ncbi:MAG: cbb3-type cytochrome c oxidase subunit II, partial [Colwellia sp.]|nr:cbb3-type cytochrome c oxidase subunit II [Colwellia sp.]
MKNIHEKVEKNVGLFFLFTVLAISIGGLVEITPLFFQKELAQP